jgi:hypothetical protein
MGEEVFSRQLSVLSSWLETENCELQTENSFPTSVGFSKIDPQIQLRGGQAL